MGWFGVAGGRSKSSSWPEMVQYVHRDYDDGLHERLRLLSATGGFMVVTGDSSTGKTRSLYEAVRSALPSWQIFIPADAEAVRLGAPDLAVRTVVWLDDTPTEKYLGKPGGLAAIDVVKLLERGAARPVIVLDILWPAQYQKLTHIPTELSAPDPYRDAREALALAGEPWRVPGRFSAAEHDRAAVVAAGDARAAEALADVRFGFTQFLAGVPELLVRWHDADAYAGALIAAAIDAHRVGIDVPLDATLLEDASVGYLADHQRAVAKPDWFATALEYVTSPGKGGVSILIATAGGRAVTRVIAGYLVADYLLQPQVHRRHLTPVPEATWRAFIDHTDDPRVLARLAESAGARLLDPVREHALRRQMVIGDARKATWALAKLLGAQGRAEAVDYLSPTPADDNDHERRIRVDVLAGLGREPELRQFAERGDTHAQRALVRMLLAQGRDAQAREVAGENKAAAKLLAELLEGQGRRTEAIDCLKPWVLAGRRDLDLALTLGELLIGSEREDELWQLFEMYKGSRYMHRVKARFHASAGRYDEAYDHLVYFGDGSNSGGIRRFEEFYRLLSERGREAELRRFTEFRSVAMHYLARLLLAQGRHGELREMRAAGTKLAPEILAGIGEVDEALGELWRCIERSLRSGSHGLGEAASGEWDAERLVAIAVAHDRGESMMEALESDDSPGRRLVYLGLLAACGREAELRDHAARGDWMACLVLARFLNTGQRDGELREMVAAGGDWFSRALLRQRLDESGQGRWG